MSSLSTDDLRQRVLRGVRAQIEALGTGAPDAAVHRVEGITACVGPSTPERSLFNSVHFESAEALEGELDGLARIYERSGVRAWTVWVPDDDEHTAALLERRGHVLDASPRAMALELDELVAPAVPQGVRAGRCPQAVATELNDRAYGYEAGAFRTGLSRRTQPEMHWSGAIEEGQAISCLATIGVGDDCAVTAVATPREHRGRGLASWLLHTTLAEARERGARSASLVATKLGAPVYERIGFRDLGRVDMWELRRQPAG